MQNIIAISNLLIWIVASVVILNLHIKIQYYESKLKIRSGWYSEQEWEQLKKYISTHWPLFHAWFWRKKV